MLIANRYQIYAAAATATGIAAGATGLAVRNPDDWSTRVVLFGASGGMTALGGVLGHESIGGRVVPMSQMGAVSHGMEVRSRVLTIGSAVAGVGLLVAGIATNPPRRHPHGA